MGRLMPLVVLVLVAGGCGPAQGGSDAGAVDAGPVDYKGETTGGPIPELPREDPPWEDVDAGEFQVDRRCCNLDLAVSDEEPEEATGRLRGQIGSLAGDGVPLTRAGGRWAASVCIPLVESTPYWFEFTWTVPPPDDVDAGPEAVTMIRADPNQATDSDGNGNTVNFFAAGSTCANEGTLP